MLVVRAATCAPMVGLMIGHGRVYMPSSTVYTHVTDAMCRRCER